VTGRRIDRAVLKQTIQRPDSRHPMRSDKTKTGLLVSDKFFEDQAREDVIGILEKYIVFQDVNHHYWVDRLWYFDVEQYERDLGAFGIPIAKPVREPAHSVEEK
jgi:hypothetical protein